MVTEQSSPSHGRPRKVNWVLLGFLAVAAYFLFMEHKAHVLSVLPWLLLIACPLLHLFMHGGHGGHGNEDHHNPPDKSP